jgi:predicted CopG family antitoxin
MNTNDRKTIVVQHDVYDKLRAKAHYGQTLSGVIKELLEKVESYENKTGATANTQQ